MGDEKSYKVLFSEDGKTLLSLPEDYVGEYEIPYGVTCLNEKRNVFEKCNVLTAIRVPSTVKRLGLTSLADCKNLKSIVIDPDNPFYDSREDCNAIIATSTNILLLGCQNTIIPSGVKEISNLAFSGCTGLVSIRIPDSVRKIGSAAFYNCTGLSSVEIGNGVSEISDSAFENCTSLKSIEIPAHIIKKYAFNNCESLTSVKILKGAFSIEFAAFLSCTSLKKIRIPNSIEMIENSVFRDTGLTSIEIPASVKYIEGNFCDGTTSEKLTSIKVSERNKKYDSRNDSNAVIETATDILVAGCKTTKIPEGIKRIGSSAFCSCYGLKSIEIPASVVAIEKLSFYNCTRLKSIRCKAENPPYLFKESFDYVDKKIPIYIPKGSLERYKKSKWSEYFENFIEDKGNLLSFFKKLFK